MNIACPTNLVLDTDVFEKNEFLVYPNPCSDFISAISNENTIKSVTIYSVLGEKVIIKLTEFENIDTSKLQSGLYLLYIESEKAKEVVKFIKR